MVSFVIFVFPGFLANLVILHIFSTLGQNSSPDINGDNRVTLRHPMTFQKNNMSIHPTGGGHELT